jgi:hypothetical protein
MRKRGFQLTNLAAHLASKKYNNTTKCLIILDHLGRSAAVAEIKKVGHQNGLRTIKDWNVGALYRSNPERVSLVEGGWKLLPEGKAYIAQAGYDSEAPEIVRVRSPLRKLAEVVKSPSLKGYLTECLDCFDSRCYRASTIMAWCAAVDVLHSHISSTHFAQFKAAFVLQFPKRAGEINNGTDLERIKESDLLLVAEKIGIFGKTVKKQLEARLDERNAAGHPNGVTIQKLQAAAHLEFLHEHIFSRYAV